MDIPTMVETEVGRARELWPSSLSFLVPEKATIRSMGWVLSNDTTRLSSTYPHTYVPPNTCTPTVKQNK